tara:strand:- start:5244 stop:5969 length:726 start_codon:yes stop_codon:yes gene_type:complete
MNLQRVFLDTKLYKNMDITLDRLASKHLSRVLRMKQGAKIELFDGKGNSGFAEVISSDLKEFKVKIVSKIQEQKNDGIEVNLALSIIKPSPFEYAIQKCSELGVRSISPILTERSIFKLDPKKVRSKLERWKLIAIGACEQCGQNWLPEIKSIHSLEDWIRSLDTNQRLAFVPRASKRLSEIKLKSNLDIIIGPEGDFSDSEIKLLNLNGFDTLNLGSRILRSDTAAIVALSSLRALKGEF